MSILLLLVVVLALFLQPAAAANTMFDNSMAVVPMEPFLADMECVLDPICQYCAIPFYKCIHAVSQAPYAAARMLYHEPRASCHPLPDVHQTADDLAPVLAYVTEARRQLLMNENLRYVNANETTIQPATVQAHIEDTYTPGDRLGKSSTRKAPHRRQAPRFHGYPCRFEGCERTFDRACELNRHKKTHLGSSERPHQCEHCHEGFLYPKDLARHQKKHIDQPSDKNNFYCEFRGCNNLEGFSRRDNLLRHQRKKHSAMVAAS
ncbi:hypothetical protein DE146DRAFT_226199 [Phaeosphaeria sp. MPI-PUGE-AT-0046c]|nr:hypothetical protein DE146DRAFT_226199 [Phaeosphaeria sp. MPI-PUGE-AT-0046c]